jgi:hypothetical protein
MKKRIVTVLALAFLISDPLRPATAFAQGSLTPSGPPAPTMKTLGQIEPRTPIESLPYTIATPGSYFLTGPHNSTNKGITVSSSDVTIDLMGFTISGPQSPNLPGIHVAGGADVMIRNFTIRNGGVTRFGVGVLIENAQVGQVRDLTIHQNVAEGLVLRNNSPGVCTDYTVEQCRITDNGGVGIYLNGTNTVSNVNRSHIIRNNTISGNRDFGLDMIWVNGSLVDGNVFGPQVANSDAYAIRSREGRNLVVRNFEQGNTNESGIGFFFFQTLDTRGPIVSVGALPHTNSPWANFSRP